MQCLHAASANAVQQQCNAIRRRFKRSLQHSQSEASQACTISKQRTRHVQQNDVFFATQLRRRRQCRRSSPAGRAVAAAVAIAAIAATRRAPAAAAADAGC